MKRAVFVILTMILSACGSAPSGYDWCYVYAITEFGILDSTNSAYLPNPGYLGNGYIDSYSGQISLNTSDISPTGATVFEIQIQPLAPYAFFNVDYSGSVFGHSVSGTGSLTDSLAFVRVVPSVSSSSISIDMDSYGQGEYRLSNPTVYGTGTNPYPRNDCAPTPTNTPAPPPATETPSPTNTTPPSATNTPATPPINEGLNIPMDSAFTSLNDWIAMLAPVLLFVGMIPVAIAVLRWIASKIRDVFGGA